MKEFSFLNYLGKFSNENLLIVEDAAQLKNRKELALIAGVSYETIKGWFTVDEANKRKRIPAVQAWDLLLYQLEARRTGFYSLVEIFQSLSAVPCLSKCHD